MVRLILLVAALVTVGVGGFVAVTYLVAAFASDSWLLGGAVLIAIGIGASWRLRESEQGTPS